MPETPDPETLRRANERSEWVAAILAVPTALACLGYIAWLWLAAL